MGYCNHCYNNVTDIAEIDEHRKLSIAEAVSRWEASEAAKAKSEGLFSLVYSSGSTGEPKGCMLMDSSWNNSTVIQPFA
jgi:long-subunit acyl-CoA synthetase (AMP-forming)